MNCDRRVLIYPSGEQDGLLACRILGSVGIEAAWCGDIEGMAAELAKGVGALLIVEELIPHATAVLRRYLDAQEPWSDLPVLLLTKQGADSLEAQRAVESLGNVTLLERPVRTMALVSAARSALRARDRQYQVRLANRRKDEFLATLAHELRNPLAPIGNAMSIMQRLKPSADLARLTVIVQRQVTHLARLVDDLLDVARIANDKVVLRKANTRLGAVVADAVEIASSIVEERRHRLQVELPQADFELFADHARVVQCLSNLLVNAAKFTSPGGEISLQVRVHETIAEFHVRDNGCGLDTASLSAIFELFMQAPTPGEQPSGLGIGLNLARRFAQMHGGTIVASSAGLGRGSEFVLSLPIVVAAASSRVGAPAPEPGSAAARRVLVVDDNPDAASTLEALLTMHGMSVAVAHDGAAAVAAVHDDPPDAVVMDIGMPLLDGYEAARRIRRDPVSEHITLIALTGWGQDEDRQLAQQAGFDFHLVKPLDFSALLGCLDSRPLRH